MIKKLTALVSAALMMTALAVPALAASPSSVTISGSTGKAPVSFMYDDNYGEIEKSVKHLLPDINKATAKNSVSQTLSIHSISTLNKPVTIGLRLSVSQNKTTGANSASPTASPQSKASNVLDYYNIVITDSKGASVYDSSRSENAAATARYKDIPLNTMNEKVPVEKETYKLVISVNPDLSKLSASAEQIDWKIVINGDQKASSPVSSALPSASPEASVYPSETPGVKETPTPLTTAPADVPTPPALNLQPEETTYYTPAAVPEEPTPTPRPTPTPYQGKRVLSSGLYTVGDEIAAGRYEITGDSTVKVYTAQGDLKTNIILTTNKNLRDGVESYVLTLRDGELIETSADTTFTEYVPTRTTPKPTTKPTATARATAKPKTSTKPTATPKSKTNPATGDNAPIVPAAIILAAALAGVAALEIYRRRKKN